MPKQPEIARRRAIRWSTRAALALALGALVVLACLWLFDRNRENASAGGDDEAAERPVARIEELSAKTVADVNQLPLLGGESKTAEAPSLEQHPPAADQERPATSNQDRKPATGPGSRTA